MSKHYNEYFSISEDYVPCMDKNAINRNKRTWLNYYPHKTFIDILRELLQQLNGGNRAIWLTGAYGTGKSHAALVIQKLFMDDESLVIEWLDRFTRLIPAPVRDQLLARRKEKILVIFESGSTGVNATNQFLVRIERAITTILADSGYAIPAKGTLESIISRVHEEGEHFFKSRDAMQSKLDYLNPSIETSKEIEILLREPGRTDGLIEDVVKVLQARNIYLDISTETLLKWIKDILTINDASRMVFVWDEFSTFVEQNRTELKTMEEIAEAAQQGDFFFMPVTHMNLGAYVAEGSESAKKAKDRFIFKALDMPTNTALKLAANAFIPNETLKPEWAAECDILWSEVKNLVEIYMLPKLGGSETVESSDFMGVLPIHPMAGFVLQHLATAIGSNQRSLFDFLKGSAYGNEFQDFINQGGLDERNKQFLTVDYLWHYFVERDDLGASDNLKAVRTEFARHKQRLQPEEQRVFKAVLLFSLLGRALSDGHELLQPTEENIRRSFTGDAGLSGVDSILRNLADQHCFSLVNGRCEMFGTAVDNSELIKKKATLQGKFSNFVLEEKTQGELTKKIRDWNYGTRYEVRALGVDALAPSNIKFKEAFGPEGNQVLIQFVLAKDHAEQLQADTKIQRAAEHFKNYRIVFLTMPDVTFCSQNANQWDTYLEQWASYDLARDSATKNLHKQQIEILDQKWFKLIMQNDREIRATWLPSCDGILTNEKLGWGQLQKFLENLTKTWFSDFTDDLSGYNIPAFGLPNSLQNWATAGIQFEKMDKPGPWKKVIDNYQQQKISGEDAWFSQNPNHNLTKIRNYCKSRLDNTVGKGAPCSIRKIYIDLQRQPFGLRRVPHSAFILGFAMKEWLTSSRQLQWTDNINSHPLTIGVLAEIIEEVVKDDGDNKIKNEKLICRLSPEEKAFVENYGIMFNIHAIQDGTIESSLLSIQKRLEDISGKTPLWIIPDYIRTHIDDDTEQLCSIVEDLCAALQISSKSDTAKRSSHIKNIGTLLKADPILASKFSEYMIPDMFDSAFREYVDRNCSELKAKAEASGDKEPTYYRAISEKFAQTSGWLWKSQDIEPILNEVSRRYDVIISVQRLTRALGFVSFEESLGLLQRAVFDKNKVSLACLVSKYPILQILINALSAQMDSANIEELAKVLNNYAEIIERVFFDAEHNAQIQVLKVVLGESWPQGASPKEELEIYATLGQWAKSEEDFFKEQGVAAVRTFADGLLSSKLQKAWQERTGSTSPSAWSIQHQAPALFLFAEQDAAFRDLINIVDSPSDTVPAKQLKAIERLATEASWAPDIANWEGRFLKYVLPERYWGLTITAKALAHWLEASLGSDANRWLDDPKLGQVVEDFVKKNYENGHKKLALEAVHKMSDKEAKQRLLELIEKNPDVGLAIME